MKNHQPKIDKNFLRLQQNVATKETKTIKKSHALVLVEDIVLVEIYWNKLKWRYITIQTSFSFASYKNKLIQVLGGPNTCISFYHLP